MAVPLLDLKTQYAPLKQEVMARFEAILDSQYMIGGPEVTGFEAEAAAYCGTKHAIAVSSGTDALVAALMALDIGPGDEVITTPFTFFATAGAIHRVGATPVFVDIDPQTFLIRPDAVEAAITDKTKAIMPVHLFGQMADMDALADISEKHNNLPIIEDAAQAIGAAQRGHKAGSQGTIGCFSFFPSKNLGGAGDGGLITTQDDALAQKILMTRNHGAHDRYYHDFVGGNFRLDALQCAYLSVKLPHLDSWHEARRKNAAFYNERFATCKHIQTPVIALNNTSIYNQYTLRVADRDGLQAFLQERGIGCAVYYPLCLHQQACFKHLSQATGSLPESEKAAADVLSLPIYPELTEAQLNEVATAVLDFYGAV